MLVREHVPPEFDTHRAARKTCSDGVILDMFARICANKESAHPEPEYGWLTDDDLIYDDSTFLRAMKRTAAPEGSDSQLIFKDLEDDNSMPETDRIRDVIMTVLDAATDNIINSIRGQNPSESRETITVTDITHEQFHVWSWEDKETSITELDCLKMVSGCRKDDEYKCGYKHVTITLVGDHAPIVLSIELVKENSAQEPDDPSSYLKTGLVNRLLDSVEWFVNLDAVTLDRRLYTNRVYTNTRDREITYLSPVLKYEGGLMAVQDIQEHPTADAAVKHDVPLGINGEVHHEAKFLYVPSTSDNIGGKYTVFATNRDRVEPEKIRSIVNGHSQRRDIENQYKSIRSFMPKTPSTDY